MTGSGWKRLAAAAVALLAGAALADAAPSVAGGPEKYPLALRVALSPAAARAIYTYDPVYSAGPPILGCDVAIGAQAREAYGDVARRAFQGGADAARTLTLDVAIASAEVESSAGTFTASVEHLVSVRSADGVEVSRWRLSGRERIAGLSQDALREAFSAAAFRAAEAFRAAFDAPHEVRAWLSSRGIEVHRTADGAPIPAPGASGSSTPSAPAPTPHVERESKLGYVDVGVGAVSGTFGGVVGPVIRGGFSGTLLFVQAHAFRWQDVEGRGSLEPLSAVDDGIEVSETGVEVGVLHRAGQGEVRAGVGLESYSGTITQTRLLTETEEVSAAATSLSVAMTVAPQKRAWARWRAGLEARLRFGATFDSQLYGKRVALAGPSLVLFIGGELGVGPPSAP